MRFYGDYSDSDHEEPPANHLVNIDKDFTPNYQDVYNHQLLKSPVASLVPTTASTNKQKYRVLGSLTLFGVSYMACIAGPVGSEMIISTGGPLIGLLSIAAYVLLCQMPMSFVVTELTCAFPQNGGFAVWAMAAFGPFAGFQAGYWAWISSAINNAFYPSLVYLVITSALGIQVTSAVTTYFIKIGIALFLALPSYLGVRFIGVASLVMMVLVGVTIVIFCVWGFAVGEGSFYRLGETRTLNGSSPNGDNVAWLRLLSFLFSSYDRIQWISMIGGEVRNPAHTYPRVIFITFMLYSVTYFVPFIMTVIGDKMPWRQISPSSYPTIAQALGGSGLHTIVVFSSVVTYIGMYANSVFLQSFLVQGMAQSQLLPRIFRKRSKRFKTPKYAIVADFLTTMIVSAFGYDTLLDLTNAFSAASQVVIVLSMIQLRRAFPNMYRPVRMPGNLMTITAMLIPPCCICLLVIGSTLAGDWTTARLVIAFAVPGLFIPFIRTWFAGRRICS
jgi:amino acid transporter